LRRRIRLLFGVLLILGSFAAAPGAFAQEEDDGGTAIRGTLQAAGEPVEGAVITAFDADGNEIGQAVTDSDGEWLIPMPGPGDYSASIDEASLPEDVGLRDPERATLEFNLRTGQQRTLLFPLGEDERVGTGFLARASQSLVQLRVLEQKAAARMSLSPFGIA
jgi:neutral amino acid transport system permease protein